MAPRTSRTRTAPQHRPLVSPSMTSIFSSFTQSSNGSSGSGSTITQESISKTRHRGPKRSERRTRRSSRREEPTTVNGKPNVFAYLEEEDEEAEDVKEQRSIELPQSSRRGDGETIPPAVPMSPAATDNSFSFEDVKHVSSARALSIASLHSDSGISVRGVSPDRSSASSNRKTSSKGSVAKSAALARTKSMSSNGSVSSRTSYSEHEPESFYAQPGQSPTTRAPANRQIQLRPKRQDRYGYNLLASQLSTTEEECAKPIYRRFETLNNRCLLILQEEITGIEYEIAEMDRNIAIFEGGRSPASQRADLQSSPARWRRATFCAQIAPKLTQYNRALAAYQSVANLSSTSEEQILQYKDLLEQHQPVVATEMAFLDDIADLVTINANEISPPEQQKISYELGVALFFLILAFRLIPSLIGRMILGGSLVGFLVWSGRLPIDEAGMAGVLGRRAGIYATAVFVLSLAVG